MQNLNLLMISLTSSFNKISLNVDDEIKIINDNYLIKLNKDIDFIKTKINDTITPLYVMCEYGLLEVMKWYVCSNTHFSKFNETYHFNDTPLHIAVKYNQIKIVELLSSYNININSTNIYGDSPISYAIQGNNIEIIKLLLSDKNIIEALHLSIKFNKCKILEELLQYEVSYIAIEDALQIACQYKYDAGIKLLTHHIEKL